jgi:hypothetical protein
MHRHVGQGVEDPRRKCAVQVARVHVCGTRAHQRLVDTAKAGQAALVSAVICVAVSLPMPSGSFTVSKMREWLRYRCIAAAVKFAYAEMHRSVWQPVHAW